MSKKHRDLSVYLPYTPHMVRTLLPNGTRVGNEWQLGSIGGERGKSLSICLEGPKAGLWNDFATGEKGNLLTLVTEVCGMSKPEAWEWLDDFVAGHVHLEPMSMSTPHMDEQKKLQLLFGMQVIEDGLTPLDTQGAPKSPVANYLYNRGIWQAAKASAVVSKALKETSAIGIEASNLGLFTLVARYDLPDAKRGFHLTQVTPDGHKSQITPNKKFMPAPYTLKGGAVRLFPATDTLALAEGVETALAVHQIFDWPVWATCGAQFLAAVEIPPQVQKVFICVDHDANQAGRLAGEKLALRLAQEGREVRIIDPSDFGYSIPEGAKSVDWLDVLNKNQTTQQV